MGPGGHVEIPEGLALTLHDTVGDVLANAPVPVHSIDGPRAQGEGGRLWGPEMRGCHGLLPRPQLGPSTPPQDLKSAPRWAVLLSGMATPFGSVANESVCPKTFDGSEHHVSTSIHVAWGESTESCMAGGPGSPTALWCLSAPCETLQGTVSQSEGQLLLGSPVKSSPVLPTSQSASLGLCRVVPGL